MPKIQQIVVRVPASSSNLGPGFDCLGIALRLYNEIALSRSPKTRSRGEKHPPIVGQAAALFFKTARLRPFAFSCSIAGEIPRSRGLGSSGSVRVGVLLGLNELTGKPLDRLSIFRVGARLEGHPDNVAPAIFGGFTVVRGENVQRFAISSRLAVVLLIPDLEVSTVAARQILPARISHLAAVESSANACAITAAFASEDYEELRGKFADQLHQPYRARLIPFLPRVIAAAEKAGALGAFLSGSGSTICAVTLEHQDKIAAAMKRAVGAALAKAMAATSTSASTIITSADNRGATIRHSSVDIRH
ncbi:MAG: homoserine kinase [Chthoniobacterales bacterium]